MSMYSTASQPNDVSQPSGAAAAVSPPELADLFTGRSVQLCTIVTLSTPPAGSLFLC